MPGRIGHSLRCLVSKLGLDVSWFALSLTWLFFWPSPPNKIICAWPEEVKKWHCMRVAWKIRNERLKTTQLFLSIPILLETDRTLAWPYLEALHDWSFCRGADARHRLTQIGHVPASRQSDRWSSGKPAVMPCGRRWLMPHQMPTPWPWPGTASPRWTSTTTTANAKIAGKTWNTYIEHITQLTLKKCSATVVASLLPCQFTLLTGITTRRRSSKSLEFILQDTREPSIKLNKTTDEQNQMKNTAGKKTDEKEQMNTFFHVFAHTHTQWGWTRVMNTSALTCRGGWKKKCGWRAKGRSNLKTFRNWCRSLCFFVLCKDLCHFAIHVSHICKNAKVLLNPKSAKICALMRFAHWFNHIKSLRLILAQKDSSTLRVTLQRDLEIWCMDMVDEPEDQCQSWTDGDHPRKQRTRALLGDHTAEFAADFALALLRHGHWILHRSWKRRPGLLAVSRQKLQLPLRAESKNECKHGSH